MSAAGDNGLNLLIMMIIIVVITVIVTILIIFIIADVRGCPPMSADGG